jgi:glutaconate CoA-transferase subunit B
MHLPPGDAYQHLRHHGDRQRLRQYGFIAERRSARQLQQHYFDRSSQGAPTGSGGGNDVGSHCWRTIAIIRHDRKRFLEKVDFITTPGYLDGPGGRERAGLPRDTGPYRVVSNLAVLGYHPQSKRMLLLATQPGVTVDQVIENTNFEPLIADRVENPPPTAEELRILREEVDKDRLYI